jgi:hypothetical protein
MSVIIFNKTGKEIVIETVSLSKKGRRASWPSQQVKIGGSVSVPDGATVGVRECPNLVSKGGSYVSDNDRNT